MIRHFSGADCGAWRYRLKPKRRLGVMALAIGVLSCGAFLAGLL